MDNVEEKIKELQDEIDYWRDDLEKIRFNKEELEKLSPLNKEQQDELNMWKESERADMGNMSKAKSEIDRLQMLRDGKTEVITESRKRSNDTDFSNTSNKRKT
jgi:hypothetical protein